MKAVLNHLVIFYFRLRYTFAVCGVVHILAQINAETGAELPCDYTWGERYILWIEYLQRRGDGIKCTFEEVEFEYLKEWNDKFQEAKKRFEEYRKENPIGDALL